MKLPTEIFVYHMDSERLFACSRDWSAWMHGTMTDKDFEKLGESEAFNDCFADIEESENELVKRAEDAEDKVKDLEKEIKELKEQIRDLEDAVDNMSPNF